MTSLTTASDDGVRVQIRALSKQYGQEKVVQAFSADLEAGEFFSVLGPSGSGKTTALMMIAGFAKSDSGEILVNGRDIARTPPQKRDLGMVFQNYALFPHLTVYENIAFPLKARGMASSLLPERIAWAIDMVRLQGMEQRYPRQMSGGQQQRVAIARAIVFHPKLILMDEPLGALDRNLRKEMQAELKDIQSRLGMTTVYVTHDQEEALTMSDRLAIMNRGKTMQIGSPRDVYEEPANSFVARFLGEANLIDASVVETSGGSVLVQTASGHLLRGSGSAGQGAAVSLFVRPEKVSLDRAAGSDQQSNRIPVTVKGARFEGNTIRYALEADNGLLLTAEVQNSGRSFLPGEGERAEASWDVAMSRILAS